MAWWTKSGASTISIKTCSRPRSSQRMSIPLRPQPLVRVSMLLKRLALDDFQKIADGVAEHFGF